MAGRTALCTSCISRTTTCTLAPPTRRQLLEGTAASWLLLASPVLAVVQEQSPSIERVRDVIRRSFIEDKYFVSGKLPREVYDNNALFSDPQQSTRGAEYWSQAVPRQFDYQNSQIDLISIDIQDAHTIEIRFRLDGKFTPLFLGLKLKPFTGSCVFKTNDKGLVVEQKESWDTPASDLAISALPFFRSYGAPPALPVDNPLKP